MAFRQRRHMSKSIGSHTRRTWNDMDGNTLIEAFSISGMGHGVPLNSAMGWKVAARRGHSSSMRESPRRSTSQASGIWGRIWSRNRSSLTLAPDITSQPHQLNNGSRAVVKVERVDGQIDSDQDSVNPDVENHPRPYDPTVVIAAALKAAGLPVPKFPAGSTGARVCSRSDHRGGVEGRRTEAVMIRHGRNMVLRCRTRRHGTCSRQPFCEMLSACQRCPISMPSLSAAVTTG